MQPVFNDDMKGDELQIPQQQYSLQQSLIRLPNNSPNIDIDFLVNRLYAGYQTNGGSKMIYHIAISSSASIIPLLFSRFIKAPTDRCFSIANNMAFLIEIPTDLASLSTKSNNTSVQDEFYLLHKPMNFAIQKVNHKTNPFLLTSDCHYATKFLCY